MGRPEKSVLSKVYLGDITDSKVIRWMDILHGKQDCPYITH